MVDEMEPPKFPNADQVVARMDEQKKRQAEMEKDSFFKTALVAYTANFFAHNTQISPEQIVAKCASLAELTWDALVEYRGRQK